MSLEEMIVDLNRREESVQRQLRLEGHLLLNDIKDIKGFSLRRTAREIGVSPTYLSMIKNRKIVVSKETYLKLARLI